MCPELESPEKHYDVQVPLENLEINKMNGNRDNYDYRVL